MSYRDGLARSAVTEALRFRSRHGRSPDDPICPIDLALDAGVEVRFKAISRLEGMYTPDEPLIILGALRPRGRRAYTCGHELGHHVFGHGLRVDELLEEDSSGRRKDDDEYLADRFAAALLMPKLAVLRAFAERRWNVEFCGPQQIYTVAGVLGVGYTTLIGYLEGTLRAISAATAAGLRKVSPKQIRARILGTDAPGELVIVDEFWRGRAVDCEIGDTLVVPAGASLGGHALEPVSGGFARARRAGGAWVERAAWRVEVRVARPGYAGLADYRYLEDADDDP